MRRIAAAVVGACSAVAGCTTPLEPARVLPNGSESTRACTPVTECSSRPSKGGVGAWTVRVSVEPAVVGPVRVSLRDLRRAPANDARPWIELELVFENRRRRPITFVDTRRSAIVGPRGRRALLAADVGCGYGFATPRGPIEAGACAAYLDILTLKAHGSESRTVTLFKGLRGLDRLEPGTYVFAKPIRFQPGHELPEDGEGRAAVLRLVYELERTNP